MIRDLAVEVAPFVVIVVSFLVAVAATLFVVVAIELLRDIRKGDSE